MSDLTANPVPPVSGGGVEHPPVMEVDFRGEQGPLFWLALKTAALTLATFGIYRFWAKTRIRKYFWSATAPDGDPLEYTGNGLEKLLGFLIAVAFLAVYLGIFQLGLSFAGMSFFNMGDGSSQQDIIIQVVATYASFFAIVPFIFYAQYRARRYILSRTRWRGVRFGVEAAAWGYVWRAIIHSFLTLITFGLLAPRQTFLLEKYKIDRTWYGTGQFAQNGRWQELYPAMKHIFIGVGCFLLIPLILFALTEAFVFLVVMIVAYFWIAYGVVYYRVQTFRLMAERKSLDGDITFLSEPLPSKVFWTYVLGGLLASTCAGLVLSAFFIVGGNIIGVGMDFEAALEPGGNFEMGPRQFIGFAFFALGYIALILLYGVFGMIFVTQPVLQHYVENTRIVNGDRLLEIEQRSRDEMVEAEGFADALDVGAAI